MNEETRRMLGLLSAILVFISLVLRAVDYANDHNNATNDNDNCITVEKQEDCK